MAGRAWQPGDRASRPPLRTYRKSLLAPGVGRVLPRPSLRAYPPEDGSRRVLSSFEVECQKLSGRGVLSWGDIEQFQHFITQCNARDIQDLLEAHAVIEGRHFHRVYLVPHFRLTQAIFHKEACMMQAYFLNFVWVRSLQCREIVSGVLRNPLCNLNFLGDFFSEVGQGRRAAWLSSSRGESVEYGFDAFPYVPEILSNLLSDIVYELPQ